MNIRKTVISAMMMAAAATMVAAPLYKNAKAPVDDRVEDLSRFNPI